MPVAARRVSRSGCSRSCRAAELALHRLVLHYDGAVAEDDREPSPGPTQLTMEQMRARQLRLLDALTEHCDAHGLRYYLCAGTLLGAVRHGGYIPWDDDIDVMLPRADYDRFCATFPSPTAPAGISLRSLVTRSDHVLPFAKLCDDRSRLEVESDIIKGLGVFIDVFPLDGWSDSRSRQTFQRIVLKALLDVMRIKHVVLRRKRARGRNVLLAVAKLVLSPLPPRRVALLMERVARLGPFDASSEGGVISWGYQESVPVSAYGVPTKLKFEDRQCSAPGDPDTVLRVLYGDYRQLPPVDQQVTLHRFVAYDL